MAAVKSTAVKPAFDVAAYLASVNTPKQSLLSLIGDKVENAVQRVGYRAGKVSESLAGTGEVFTLGQKVGAIDAMARTESFRARAAAEISAKLASLA